MHYQEAVMVDYFRTPDEGLLLILIGKAEVFIESAEGLPVILEILQAGEIVGFSNFANYLGDTMRPLDRHKIAMDISADSHCLQIPYSVIQDRLKHRDVRDFVMRKMSSRLANVYSSLGEQVKLTNEWGESEQYVRRVQDLMNTPAITVNQDDLVQDIARIMVEKSISSVMVVDYKGKLIGIVTEKDLVQRVVANGLSGPIRATAIMTRKLHTVSRHDYYYEVLSAFYKYGVKHLPVIEEERLIGVVTFSNLIYKQNRGSMAILKTIEEASFENLPVVKNAIYDVLSSLISDEISTIHTLEIITKLYDRLACHCIKLAVKSLEAQGKGSPPVPFSWYQMGSGARGEQFMLTDQDHFLVYADPVNENEYFIDEYFALLGDEIVLHLEQAGYSRCKGLMMSSEKNWRGSVTEWQQRLRTWAIESKNEQILLGYNFLSFRFLFGDHSLNEQFINIVQRQLMYAQTFLYYMAQQEQDKPIPTLEQQPFLALFKGKEKRQVIDIKMHALFPLHHCLQILGVHNNIINATPLQLLDGLVSKKEISAGFAEDIRHAYEIALSTRIQMSWKKHLQGEEITTEIKFALLRRWEQDEIKTMLNTTRSLQSHLLAKL